MESIPYVKSPSVAGQFIFVNIIEFGRKLHLLTPFWAKSSIDMTKFVGCDYLLSPDIIRSVAPRRVKMESARVNSHDVHGT